MIVLFVRYNLIDELKTSYVDVADIYKIFITLHQEYERQPPEEWPFSPRARFNIWAWTISFMSLPKGTQHSRQLTVSLLKVLISLGDTTRDTRAFKNYFECAKRVLTEEIIPLIINQCNKCNWLPYSQILCDLFKEITSFRTAEKYLNYFIDDNGDVGVDRVDSEVVSNKPMVLQSVLNVILEKQKGQHDTDFSIFFCSVWNLAKKGRLDIREYGKSQKITNIVPFLLELASEDVTNKSDDSWLDIANHFLKIKERHNAKSLELNWESGTGDMCVKKTKKVCQQDMPERDLEMLEKLRSIC